MKLSEQTLQKPGESDAALKARQPPPEGSKFEASRDTAYAESVNTNVKTLEDLLAYMKVDLKVWEVEKQSINKWECVMREPATTVRNADGTPMVVESEGGAKSTLWTRNSRKPLTCQLFQVKAWLVKRKATIRDEAFERLLEGIKTHARPKVSRRLPPRRSGACTVEVSLYDAHFGLLAWGAETGESYDLKIATARYESAVRDLAEKIAPFKPEKILMPLGNDFYHINNPEGETPASRHHLDVDGRMGKVFDAGVDAVLNSTKILTEIAPVEYIWVPGNHDPETSFFLCRVIQAYYHRDKNVSVDTGPAARKYRHFGCNLIGFTHGNEERHADLPNIMAGEMKTAWSQSTCYEWHTGHFHKRKETRYLAADTFGAVVVRTIPSIAGTDAWHFRKGYVKGNRVAEAFVFSHEDGLVCQMGARDLRGVQKS